MQVSAFQQVRAFVLLLLRVISDAYLHHFHVGSPRDSPLSAHHGRPPFACLSHPTVELVELGGQPH